MGVAVDLAFGLVGGVFNRRSDAVICARIGKSVVVVML